MASIRSHRDTALDQALCEGDFVEVRFSMVTTDGLMGKIVEHNKQFLRVIAHQPTGKPYKQNPCLAWEILIPWSSVFWIRHLPAYPDVCDCMVA